MAAANSPAEIVEKLTRARVSLLLRQLGARLRQPMAAISTTTVTLLHHWTNKKQSS
jgi:hypothetical protein